MNIIVLPDHILINLLHIAEHIQLLVIELNPGAVQRIMYLFRNMKEFRTALDDIPLHIKFQITHERYQMM